MELEGSLRIGSVDDTERVVMDKHSLRLMKLREYGKPISARVNNKISVVELELYECVEFLDVLTGELIGHMSQALLDVEDLLIGEWWAMSNNPYRGKTRALRFSGNGSLLWRQVCLRFERVVDAWGLMRDLFVSLIYRGLRRGAYNIPTPTMQLATTALWGSYSRNLIQWSLQGGLNCLSIVLLLLGVPWSELNWRQQKQPGGDVTNVLLYKLLSVRLVPRLYPL